MVENNRLLFHFVAQELRFVHINDTHHLNRSNLLCAPSLWLTILVFAAGQTRPG